MKQVILKRRGGEEGDGHHGGAWKVAYADFATAMMAFFLLLWLLSSTNDDQRKGLADFFDETIPISPVSGGGSGILGGHDMFAPPDGAGSLERGLRPDNVDRPEREGAREDGDRKGEEFGGNAGAGDGGPPGEDALGAAIADALDRAGQKEVSEHVRVRVTPQGLVIELVELIDEPLFEPGRATPAPLLRELLDVVVPAIAGIGNRLAVLGHTDAAPFPPGSATTNWELSANRANAARRLMLDLGLPESRISHVVGYGATAPLDADPLAPQNRRIAIKLLRPDALVPD